MQVAAGTGLTNPESPALRVFAEPVFWFVRVPGPAYGRAFCPESGCLGFPGGHV